MTVDELDGKYVVERGSEPIYFVMLSGDDGASWSAFSSNAHKFEDRDSALEIATELRRRALLQKKRRELIP